MSYKGFYRYIYKNKDSFDIIKDNEKYGTYRRLEDALYERDRLIGAKWDWDDYMSMPETNNGYIHIDLPPFDHTPSYITREPSAWIVRSKGAKPKYYGTYRNEDEAKNVARIYNANIYFKEERFTVRKTFNGEKKFFGRYKTRKEAEEKVEELISNNWERN